jgi:hypothetical protein
MIFEAYPRSTSFLLSNQVLVRLCATLRITVSNNKKLNMGKIKIISAPEVTASPDHKAQSKGLFDNSFAPRTLVNEIDSETLQQNLNHLVQELNGTFDTLEQQQGFQLKQFTVSVEINAKGGVTLVGKLEAGAKAAVTLVFEKEEK